MSRRSPRLLVVMRWALLPLAVAAVTGCGTPQRPDAPPARSAGPEATRETAREAGPEPSRLPTRDRSREFTHEQFTESIAGTAVSFVMKPVPAGRITLQGKAARVKAFWISETEVTWNAYDVYIFGLDRPEGAAAEGPDAVTRPSKPYISMDRGFGHSGYPAISMSHHAARSFCAWLSDKTGRTYRLPTELEWQYACGLGNVDAARLGTHAWFRDNAGFRTHRIATRAPDDLGLYDMYGNASEWCTGTKGRPVTLGGSYRDSAHAVGCGARVPPKDTWNASDPQIPKSVWWLADAGFVGFRVVCEPK
ncbi:MAG: formylglycine-generating enzyme family protein [Planctomycetota bacterium]